MNPKQAMQMRKMQKELAKEVAEVEAGDGAVKIQINGEQKVKDVTLDPERTQDQEKLEKWLESAITQAISKSQQIAADKMKSMGGDLNLGM
ncbi:nucleoid-associated protein, YbaB/EbfC family [Candidatus Saccharibacteria bacterium SW_7_54_9]|nr:MAG: nucleoid-associated protein, YbaB/EbfC family [Candidatus Saccharibacteria bacterium SW_7_54_9]